MARAIVHPELHVLHRVRGVLGGGAFGDLPTEPGALQAHEVLGREALVPELSRGLVVVGREVRGQLGVIAAVPDARGGCGEGVVGGHPANFVCRGEVRAGGDPLPLPEAPLHTLDAVLEREA